MSQRSFTMKRKDAIVGISLLLASCSSGPPTPAPSSGPLAKEDLLRQQLTAGGAVNLPAGMWVVNDPPLTTAAGTVLRGAGIGKTIIKYTGTSHLLADNDNVVISDLTLDGSLCPPANPATALGNALAFIRGANSSLVRVRIQSSTAFGVFVNGGTSTRILQCQFDDCGRTYGQDTLGGGPNDDRGHLPNTGVLYNGNVFTNCHGNAIDNCKTSGTWSNNIVLSLASTISSSAGDIIADGGCSSVIIKNNSLHVGSIQVYGATTGCLTIDGEPRGCQILDNVIQTGTLCGAPLCAGIYIVPGYGNSHSGNVIAGVAVD
jgi:hypothetical protein